MHWIAATLLSAFFAGVNELSSKHAIQANAVTPVLFFTMLYCAAAWIGLMVVQVFHPGSLPASLVTDPITLVQHLQLVLKAAIVAAAWATTYFGLKHLPVSLASPIRATGPLWTFLGAMVILAERPTLLESLGIVTTLVSFLGLSLVGRREGVNFHRDKWVGFLILGTLLNALSAVYDKYLLGTVHLSVPTVQAWYSIYMLVFFTPLTIGWKRRWWPRNEFQWRWSILLIAVSMLLGDYLYFAALRNPTALVSLVISLRRGSTLVSFAGGILLFREENGLQKLPAVIGILVGIVLTALG
ncbi:MAG: EamA family transporter [Verrucomicrobiota bacterium]|jgi:drug/metabolite transporter (DMT)-like permease